MTLLTVAIVVGLIITVALPWAVDRLHQRAPVVEEKPKPKLVRPTSEVVRLRSRLLQVEADLAHERRRRIEAENRVIVLRAEREAG